MPCVHFPLLICTKTPTFVQGENIALCTDSKEGQDKYLEETLKIHFPKWWFPQETIHFAYKRDGQWYIKSPNLLTEDFKTQS